MKKITLLLSLFLIILTGCQTTGLSIVKDGIEVTIPAGDYAIKSSDEKTPVMKGFNKATITYVDKQCIVAFDKMKFTAKMTMLNENKIIELKLLGNEKDVEIENVYLYFIVREENPNWVISPMDKSTFKATYKNLSGKDNFENVLKTKGKDGKSTSSISVCSVKTESDVGNWLKVLSDKNSWMAQTISLSPIK